MIWKRPMRAIDFVIWMPVCVVVALCAPGSLFILLNWTAQ